MLILLAKWLATFDKIVGVKFSCLKLHCINFDFSFEVVKIIMAKSANFPADESTFGIIW